MTPRQARHRAVEATRAAHELRHRAAFDLGTVRDRAGAWLAVADAFEVAADAWLEAAALERDPYETYSLTARAGDANQTATDIIEDIRRAYTPRSLFERGRGRWPA